MKKCVLITLISLCLQCQGPKDAGLSKIASSFEWLPDKESVAFGSLPFLKTLEDATLVVLDEGGHGGASKACRSRAMIDFMDDPHKKIDLSCLPPYTGNGRSSNQGERSKPQRNL